MTHAVLLDDQGVGDPVAEARLRTSSGSLRAVGEPARHVRPGADGERSGARRAARRAGASAARCVTGQSRSTIACGSPAHPDRSTRGRANELIRTGQLGWLVVKTFEELWAELSEKAAHPSRRVGHRAPARRRRARDRQEAGRGGGRVVDGRRARGHGARGRGDQPAALPRPGADAGHRTSTSTTSTPTSEDPDDHRPPPHRRPQQGRRCPSPPPRCCASPATASAHDAKELTLVDAENGVEFFYLRPRDIALYVGEGTLDVGITGRDLLLDSGAKAEEVLGARLRAQPVPVRRPDRAVHRPVAAGRAPASPRRTSAWCAQFLAERGIDADGDPARRCRRDQRSSSVWPT